VSQFHRPDHRVGRTATGPVDPTGPRRQHSARCDTMSCKSALPGQMAAACLSTITGGSLAWWCFASRWQSIHSAA